jgi:hypothetical protein
MKIYLLGYLGRRFCICTNAIARWVSDGAERDLSANGNEFYVMIR